MLKETYPILAGVLFGVAAMGIKIYADGITSALQILNNLGVILAIVIITGFGFVLFQLGLKKVKGSVNSLLTAIFATVIPVLGGFYLGEVLSITEILGLVSILSGSFIIIAKSK